MLKRDICERLINVAGLVRSETFYRITAARPLPEEAMQTILSPHTKVKRLEDRVEDLTAVQKGVQ